MIGPLAVSNLAWPADALGDGLALLARLGCTAVEIAPYAVFGRWTGIADEARRLRDRLDAYGLECCALQGIAFAADDVSLFGSAAQQARLEQHLDHVAALAGLLGARACVFGAPRQRDPGDLGADEAWHRALGGLRRIAPAFAAVGSALAFEAVPASYGNQFVTTTAEAVRLVSEAAVPGVGLQIDTGTLFAGAEDPSVLIGAGPLAVHLHVSEPELAPVGQGSHDHLPIAAALVDSGYEGSISIEMQPVPGWPDAVAASVAFVRDTYL